MDVEKPVMVESCFARGYNFPNSEMDVKKPVMAQSCFARRYNFPNSDNVQVFYLYICTQYHNQQLNDNSSIKFFTIMKEFA